VSEPEVAALSADGVHFTNRLEEVCQCILVLMLAMAEENKGEQPGNSAL
jgi:hypothetical protein